MSAARDVVEQFARSILESADWPVAWKLCAIDEMQVKIGDWQEQGTADGPAALYTALWRAAIGRASLFAGTTRLQAQLTLARSHPTTKKPVTTTKQWVMDGASEAALQRAEEEQARTTMAVTPVVLAPQMPAPMTGPPQGSIPSNDVGVLTMVITHQQSVITWLYALLEKAYSIVSVREDATVKQGTTLFERIVAMMERAELAHQKVEGERLNTIERMNSEAVAEAKKVRDALLEVDKMRLEELKIKERSAVNREMIDAVKPAIPSIFRGLAAKVGLDLPAAEKPDAEEDDADDDDKPADAYSKLDAAMAEVAATLKDPATKAKIDFIKSAEPALIGTLTKFQAAYDAVVAEKAAADKAAAEAAHAASNSTGTAQA